MKKQKQLSRKDLRKLKKQQKKQRIQKYHQSRAHKTQNSAPSLMPMPQPAHKHPIQQLKRTASKQAIKKAPKIDKKKLRELEQIELEQKAIQMYEKKLKIKEKGNKYNSLAKGMGFDDDLFNFLDNISKKVRDNQGDMSQQGDVEEVDDFQQQSGSPQSQEQQSGEMEQSDEINEMDEQEFNDDSEELMRQMDQQLMQRQAFVQTEPKETKKSKQSKNVPVQKQPAAPQRPKFFNKKQPAQQEKPEPQHVTPEQTQVHKKMNSLFNKLSDGNLLITFREFVNIFQSHPKSITQNTFAKLFTKFNLLVQKPLVHVMSANIVIAVSLHRVYGDRLMALLLHNLTQGFIGLQSQQQNTSEVEEIGYSKIFEKKKNYVTIICYLYEFSSISASFPGGLVSQLSADVANKENIELIYHTIQKCGVRMRNNDPATLKDVIETIRKMIEEAKKLGIYETTKVKFIEIQINQIRFNKKGLFDADQRMGFLHTFLNKTIKQQAPAQTKTLDVTYEQFKHIQDVSQPEFWVQDAEARHAAQHDDEDATGSKKHSKASQEVKALYQLAKQMHLVTEIKKNIFVELMSSQDYIEATKRLLDMRIKRLEDLATVLITVNLSEKCFNPFYVLVACKMAEEIPKLRVSLQFAIWDRLKQVTTFEPREISNLGKFTAWLISSQKANSSLSLLKYFPDLLNVKAEEDIFLKVLFKELFRKSSKNWISKLTHKLQDQKNKVTRDGIRDYVGQIIPSLSDPQHKQKASILRKLLAIQFQNQIQND